LSVVSGTATVANLTNASLSITGVSLNSGRLQLKGGPIGLSNVTDSSMGGSLLLTGATATLSGTNTYTGTTTLLGGSTLNLGVANGISTSSSLTMGGNSDTTQTNTLDLRGFSQSLTSLNSTDGQGIAIVTNSGSLATMTLTGSSFFAGSLNGNLGLTVNAGSGTVSMTGNSSSYTGQTYVQSGSLNLGSASFLSATTDVRVANGATLLLSGSNNINTSAPLTLAGGTLSMGGNGSTRASAQTFASLTLTANSVIDFANLQGNSSITFSTITMQGYQLFVYNWSGTNQWGTQSSTQVGTQTRLYNSTTSSLSADDLNNISFYSGGIGSTFLGNGTYSGTEIVPVPEPSVIVAAALLAGWMLFTNRGILMGIVRSRRRAG